MPSNQVLELILRLKDEATGALQRATQAAENSLRRLGENLQSLGRQMSQFGRNLAFLGAAITGTFGVALATASSRSIAVRSALQDLHGQTAQLQQTIAQAVVPVIHRFAQALENLNRWFQSLNPRTRDMIIQAALMAGVMATVGGVVVNLGGKLVILAGTIARVAAAIGFWPILWGTLAAVLLLVLRRLGLLDDAMRVIGGTIAVLGQAVLGLSELIASSLGSVLAFVIGLVEKFYRALAALPRRFGGEMFREVADSLRSVRENLDEFSLEAARRAVQNLATLREAFERGAISADRFREGVQEAFSNIQGFLSGGGEKGGVRGFMASFREEWDRFVTESLDLGRFFARQFIQAFQSIESGMASSIERFITQGGKFKDFLKDLGRQVVRAIVNMISAIIAHILVILPLILFLNAIPGGPFILKMLDLSVSALGPAANVANMAQAAKAIQKHHGGVIQRFQQGGEVMALLEPGEFVINRQATQKNRQLLESINRGGSAGEGGGAVVFINVSAIDTRTGTEFLLRNSKAIAEAIGLEILRNNQAFRRINRRFA